MEYTETFNRLLTEHAFDQWKRDFSDNRMTEAYLAEFLPIEQFLKTCWLNEVHGYFWDESDLSEEKHNFRARNQRENIRVFRHFRYDRHPLHAHDHFQLVYDLSGNAEIGTDAERIGLQPGDFCILAPGLRHRINAFADDISLIKFYIRSSTFENVFLRWLEENNILSDFFRRVLYESKTGRYLVFRTKGDTVMRGLMLDMYREFMEGRLYANIIVEGRLTEYFCRLVRDYSGDVIASSGEGKAHNVSTVIKYIIDHHDKVTLDDLSETVGYSKTYLCRLLKQSTGRTYTQILNTARIDAAVSMLRQTTLPIREISERVGYNNMEHFYRTFHALRGMTPKECREKYEVI